MQNEDRIVLNVGGRRFETYRQTLKRRPNTRLGQIFSGHTPYRVSEEYFFDRNPSCFAAILDWYRTKRLLIPEEIPLKMFYRELTFWGCPAESVRGYKWSFFLLKKKCKQAVKAEREMDATGADPQKKKKAGSIHSVIHRVIPVLVDSIGKKRVRQRFFSITAAQTTFQLSTAESEEGVVLFRLDDVFARFDDEHNRKDFKKYLNEAGCPATVEKFETKFTSGPRNGQYTGEFYFEIKVSLDKTKLEF